MTSQSTQKPAVHILGTTHQFHIQNSASMASVPDESIDLVVTSPPYPMIEMWDDLFCNQDPAIRDYLTSGSGVAAFEQMHLQLDPVWTEVARVLKPGGLACINIGDATRTLKDRFALYPNHSRILSSMLAAGLGALPGILWRKPTNAPTKFMGSGMYPPGAYVTLEHEHILILRKGSLRSFTSSESRQNRRASAYFWEERNIWFSDVWMDLVGTQQGMAHTGPRSRSGAFPFELPYRLINMFSAQGDTVLDPFCGLGTTLQAAMASGRNSIGIDLESAFAAELSRNIPSVKYASNAYIRKRLERHLSFVRERHRKKGPLKYHNDTHDFPVVTSQEQALSIPLLSSVKQAGDLCVAVQYASEPYRPGSVYDEDLPRKMLTRKKAPYADDPNGQVKLPLPE